MNKPILYLNRFCEVKDRDRLDEMHYSRIVRFGVCATDLPSHNGSVWFMRLRIRLTRSCCIVPPIVPPPNSGPCDHRSTTSHRVRLHCTSPTRTLETRHNAVTHNPIHFSFTNMLFSHTPIALLCCLFPFDGRQNAGSSLPTKTRSYSTKCQRS
jgi:hypothetical protein